jgi:acyl-CoA thioesterase FadM
MPLDPSIVGRSFPPTASYAVTADALRAFAASTGAVWDGGPAPATFPIVAAFEAMHQFLEAEQVELHRIVHGEQRFAYERPVVEGDELTVTLTVSSLRQIGGNDIIGTTSEVTDAAGSLVCTAGATLVHRAPEQAPAQAPEQEESA